LTNQVTLNEFESTLRSMNIPKIGDISRLVIGDQARQAERVEAKGRSGISEWNGEI